MSFYSHFSQNLKEYEKINPEVVDNLFGFIEFEKFKKSMLMAKNIDNEEYKKSERTEIMEKSANFNENKLFFEGVIKEELSQNGWF